MAHITRQASNFLSSTPYVGSDYIVIVDGTPLSIKKIGFLLVTDRQSKVLKLNNVLLVPSIKKNLLSIG
jgi:hypothetical protein